MSNKFSHVFDVVIMLSLICFSVLLRADVGLEPVHKDGLYIGVQGCYLTYGGDAFDEQTAQMALYTDPETMWVPKLDTSFGFGGIFGFREGGFGMEIGFLRSSFDGTIYDETYDTSLTMFDFNLKLWLMENSPIQPYLLIGGELCFISAIDAAELNYSPYTVGDTDLTGLSVVFGGGISYYILPEIALNVGVNYHILVLTDVSGTLDTSYELEDYIDASILNVNFGLTVTIE